MPEFAETARRSIADNLSLVVVIATIVGSNAWFNSSLGGEINARFEQIDARFDQVDARFEQIDARFDQVDARIDRINTRIYRVENRLERIEGQLYDLNGRMARVETGVLGYEPPALQ